VYYEQILPYAESEEESHTELGKLLLKIRKGHSQPMDHVLSEGAHLESFKPFFNDLTDAMQNESFHVLKKHNY
jgi:hypothetical protein